MKRFNFGVEAPIIHASVTFIINFIRNIVTRRAQFVQVFFQDDEQAKASIVWFSKESVMSWKI